MDSKCALSIVSLFSAYHSPKSSFPVIFTLCSEFYLHIKPHCPPQKYNHWLLANSYHNPLARIEILIDVVVSSAELLRIESNHTDHTNAL
jgi:hypothetical protein